MLITKRLFFIVAGLLSITCKDNIVPSTELLTDPSVKPAVIYTYPAASSLGPYDNFTTALTVRFNKLMDPASVQHAVRFDSPAGDLVPDTGRASTSAGDVYSITPVVVNLSASFLWKINQTYVLRIDPSAMDVNGNMLNLPFSMAFTPEPYFRVKTVTPANTAINVSSNIFRLQFNAPVDTAIFSQIVLTPQLPGRWRYSILSSYGVDSSQILFQGSRALPAGTGYTLSIGSGAHDKAGHLLTGGFSSSFSTVPFGISGTSPANASVNVALSLRTLLVTCTDSLDTASVPGAFHLEPSVAGGFGYSTDLTRFSFNLSSPLRPDTTYTMTFDTSFRSRSGIRLAQPYVVSFTTGNFLISSTYPSNADTAVPSRNTMYVYFNADIDTGSVRGAFSISPNVDGLFDLSQSTNSFTFSPIVDFVPGTTYTVTIGTGLLSKGGAHLAAPYSFWFTTAPFRVTSTNPRDGWTHVDRHNAIEIQTNDLIDTGTVRSSFTLSPPVSGTLELLESVPYFYFQPDTGFQPLTVYTVTIATTLKSQSGVAIQSPQSFSFATDQ